MKSHVDRRCGAPAIVQDRPSGYVRAEKLSSAVALHADNPAFTKRGIAKKLSIDEKLIRRILKGEKPLSREHAKRLPPTLRRAVEEQ